MSMIMMIKVYLVMILVKECQFPIDTIFVSEVFKMSCFELSRIKHSYENKR